MSTPEPQIQRPRGVGWLAYLLLVSMFSNTYAAATLPLAVATARLPRN
ncbi:hypothetical protein RIF23_10905 [Lipingzhangella sp. LS1_29]|uniref:MFS transporter n=1 Tax=Lipingzhangella rawalii TaxID=2055835 RepID=A0ABU2H675_9ACTN|nr:hypothetical protein [Lipingzhangella rawalii]MDS1270809.1 hypothetical protein [Lipingzhangella rawalii]